MQPDQASAVLQFLLPVIEREHATTAKVLSAVPPEGLHYKPSEKCTNAGDLTWHIAVSEQYFMTGVIEGEFPAKGITRPESVKTPADIVAWYNEQSAANHARLKALNGEDLSRIVSFHGLMVMPAIAFLQLMLTHSVHHRGQLSAYLRPMGAKVPSIYGPSADDDPFAESRQASA
jgi:uncharacterized damage-inducible protein DinB